MSAPVLSLFAAELFEGLLPLAYAEAENDYALANLLSALALPHDPIDALSLEDEQERPGWSAVLDLERCPDDWLPWLAQFNGVAVTRSGSPALWRQEISEAKGQRRGTNAAMIAAARTQLTGNKTVVLRERVGGNAYRAEMITRTAETPDAAAVRREVNKVKRAGLVWTLLVVSGQTWDEATTNWNDPDPGTSWDETDEVMV